MNIFALYKKESANMLENVCSEYILAAAKEKFGINSDNLNDFCSEMADKLTNSQKTVEMFINPESRRPRKKTAGPNYERIMNLVNKL